MYRRLVIKIKSEEIQQAISVFSCIATILLSLLLLFILFSNKVMIVDKLIYSFAIMVAFSNFLFLFRRSRQRVLLPVLDKDKKTWLLITVSCLILSIIFYINDNPLLTALMLLTSLSNPISFKGFIVMPIVSALFVFF